MSDFDEPGRLFIRKYINSSAKSYDAGRLHPSEFGAAFKLFFPHSPAEFNVLIFGLLGNPKQLLRGVTDFSQSAPFLRVILIYWVFGEWAVFKERCDWSLSPAGLSE